MEEKIYQLVIHQLQNFWIDFDKEAIHESIGEAIVSMNDNYCEMSSERFYTKNGGLVFNPVYSVTWNIFLYRLSRILYLKGNQQEADCVYYLNKIMHSTDWFYQIELPKHFGAEHPIGSVLGKAKYGDYLFVYQGTTIGANRTGGKLVHPILGNNVLLYTNATVLGKSVLGDNVIISADSYLLNENIPSNCIVYGKTPNIVIKKKDEKTIKEMTKHIWKW